MDGEFTNEASADVRAGTAEVVALLALPASLQQWLLRVEKLEVLTPGADTGLGARFLLELTAGRGSVMSFVGENVEVSAERVVRHYESAGMQAASGAYRRRVEYVVHEAGGATSVRCTVTTVIDGMSAAAARASQRAEAKSIEHSLQRLAAMGTIGAMLRWRGSSLAPTPL
jgi:hypothetical protein